MIKKISFLLVFVLAVASVSVSAQNQNAWGIKGSLIFNSNGKLIDEVGDIVDSKGKNGTGFNAGIYGVLNLGPIYIRPELVYSEASSEYYFNGSSSDFKMTSIDLPVLLGIRLIGPLNLVIGPAFKFIIDEKLDGYTVDEIENDITVGFNIGASLQLGRIGVDLIYDRGFSSNEASLIGEDITNEFTLDARPEQIRIGVSYRLSSKK